MSEAHLGLVAGLLREDGRDPRALAGGLLPGAHQALGAAVGDEDPVLLLLLPDVVHRAPHGVDLLLLPVPAVHNRARVGVVAVAVAGGEQGLEVFLSATHNVALSLFTFLSL